MNQSGGLLLAAGPDGGNSLRFAIGKAPANPDTRAATAVNVRNLRYPDQAKRAEGSSHRSAPQSHPNAQILRRNKYDSKRPAAPAGLFYS